MLLSHHLFILIFDAIVKQTALEHYVITEITFVHRGFNPKVINELATKTESFSGPERFVTILFDEMKVQEDLVWDKNTGELIGFVHLGEISVNYATLQDCKKLATHVLVFLFKSIVNPLSYSFATFATTVIVATADGASSNRIFFRIHKPLDGNAGEYVVHRTKMYVLKINVSYISLLVFLISSKQQEIVFQILVSIVLLAICGIVGVLFYGLMSPNFAMKMLT